MEKEEVDALHPIEEKNLLNEAKDVTLQQVVFKEEKEQMLGSLNQNIFQTVVVVVVIWVFSIQNRCHDHSSGVERHGGA